MDVILYTHSVHGESHIQRNANREVATHATTEKPLNTISSILLRVLCNILV